MESKERMRRSRARKAGKDVEMGKAGRPKSYLDIPLTAPLAAEAVPSVAEIWRTVQGLEGYRRTQEKRIQAIEDGAARAADLAPRRPGSVQSLKPDDVKRPGPYLPPKTPEEVAEDLRQRFGSQSSVIGFQDPRTLTGQALRDWVRRNGPVPTAFGDMEAS